MVGGGSKDTRIKGPAFHGKKSTSQNQQTTRDDKITRKQNKKKRMMEKGMDGKEKCVQKNG